MTDDLTEYELPILAGNNVGGSLATDDSGFFRLTDPYTGIGLFTTNANPLVSGIDPYTGASAPVGTDVGFGSLVQEYIISRVLNGAFAAGPPDPDSPVGEDNVLPYWKFVQESGSAFTARWSLSAANVGLVTFAMASGAAGDRAYLEQYVRISPNTSATWIHDVMPFAAGDGVSVDAYAAAQFLDGTLAATGSAVSSATLSSIGEPLYPNLTGIKADGFYIRVRIGAQRDSGAATTATGSSSVSGVVVKSVPEPLTMAWTPTLTAVTPGDLSVVYTTRSGRYHRIGRWVHCSFSIVTSTWTHSTAAGGLIITGLTFTPVTSSGHRFIGTATLNYTKANYTKVDSEVRSAESFIRFPTTGSGQTFTNLLVTDCPSGTQVTLYGDVWYELTP